MTMDHKKFRVGDLVWAKMKGFAPWPAKIENSPKDRKSPGKSKNNHQYVFFFGSENYGWVLNENIVPHSDKMVEAANLKKKTTQMQNAIYQIVELSEQIALKEKQSKNSESDMASSHHLSNARHRTQLSHIARRHQKDLSRSGKSLVKLRRQKDPCTQSDSQEFDDVEHVACEERLFAQNGASEDETYSGLAIRMTFEKRDGVPSLPDSEPDQWLKVVCLAEEKAKRTLFPQQESTSEKTSSPPDACSSIVEKHPTSSTDPTSSSKEIPNPTETKAQVRSERCLPDLDLKTEHDFLKSKDLVAINKKVGFLGLSLMGQCMVKSLLHTGHDVTVWNHTPERYPAFIDAGAKSAETPADVVLATDVVLSCFPDSSSMKEVVFGEKGVLKGFEQSDGVKTYAEMTLLNVEASKDLKQAIELRGGKYLEGSFYGTTEMAAQGGLLVIVAGERAVYDECDTCFKAIGRSVYYGGNRVGIGSVCNIALSSLERSVSSSVADMMMVSRKSRAAHHSCNLIKDTCASILSQKISTKVSVDERGSSKLRLLSSTEQEQETSNPVRSFVKSLYSDGDGKIGSDPAPQGEPSGRGGTSSVEQPSGETPTSESPSGDHGDQQRG